MQLEKGKSRWITFREFDDIFPVTYFEIQVFLSNAALHLENLGGMDSCFDMNIAERHFMEYGDDPGHGAKGTCEVCIEFGAGVSGRYYSRKQTIAVLHRAKEISDHERQALDLFLNDEVPLLPYEVFYRVYDEDHVLVGTFTDMSLAETLNKQHPTHKIETWYGLRKGWREGGSKQQ